MYTANVGVYNCKNPFSIRIRSIYIIIIEKVIQIYFVLSTVADKMIEILRSLPNVTTKNLTRPFPNLVLVN